MADNRDFVQGFMNEGGSPVYVEDKKLSEILQIKVCQGGLTNVFYT